ncbi:hypothetical protein TRFO_03963 [Tritrichomonas foetus]|uniref:HMG box domain-containing protein n=1 Tax=Tritrichomonas foetus TaxID=1144522 RepID=A0A1J4KIL4_9EUKA|nr:hypothetical protein TRFO_03963 [Tritrichomonas foetus]|eukprot:OHT11059.1 hypothetical protein TRFO_03963 [Tritrichomonas foetus]
MNYVRKPNLIPFLNYARVNKGKIQKANPKLGGREISKILGNMWANEPIEVRERFKVQSKAEMDAISESVQKKIKKRKNDDDLIDEIKVEKKSNQTSNPFFMYVNDKKSEVAKDNPNVDYREIVRILAAMWNSESQEVRNFYGQVANKIKEDIENENNQQPNESLFPQSINNDDEFSNEESNPTFNDELNDTSNDSSSDASKDTSNITINDAFNGTSNDTSNDESNNTLNETSNLTFNDASNDTSKRKSNRATNNPKTPRKIKRKQNQIFTEKFNDKRVKFPFINHYQDLPFPQMINNENGKCSSHPLSVLSIRVNKLSSSSDEENTDESIAPYFMNYNRCSSSDFTISGGIFNDLMTRLNK